MVTAHGNQFFNLQSYLKTEKAYVLCSQTYTFQAQIGQDKRRHHLLSNIYSPLQFDMVNQWCQLVPKDDVYEACHLKSSIKTYFVLNRRTKEKDNLITALTTTERWSLTLNNIARCLQSPTDRLPIGTTTEPKQSFRSLMHSLQME